MEKIINKLIDEFTKGVDTYTHNGSTWLIFTESKQWVIELTDSKTLWYNYNFFKGMFAYTSMDVVENQHYITKWVEDNIINGVKETLNMSVKTHHSIEDTLENGVKSPSPYPNKLNSSEVEHIIQNGIIEKGVTENSFTFVKMKIDCENVIENGVKEIQVNVTKNKMSDFVSDSLIKDGVKSTIPNRRSVESLVEDTIQNGIKETRLEMNITEGEVDDIIQDGVKLTQFNDNENKSWVEGVIKEGVKETNHVDVMGFFNNKMEDTLQNGVRHTLNTEYMPKTMVEDIIENGVKETKGHGFEQQNIIDDIVKDGVKETKTPGNGDLVSTVEWLKENNSNSYTKMIDDVIDNGIKETKSMDEWVNTKNIVGKVIDNGIKEAQPLPEQSGELIGYGNYYKLKEDRTKPFIDYLEETIKFGIKN